MTRHGTRDPRFTEVVDAFEQLAADDDFQAQLAIRHHGRTVVDLSTGLEPDNLLPVFSAGKGAIGVVVAHLLNGGHLDAERPVADYWPEFAAAGKSAITVGQVLSHQAGLVTVDGGLRDADFLRHEPLAVRLAAQRPLWRPGAGFGYHWLTIGTLADEIVRRCTGRTLADVFAQDITGPHTVDVHLGTDASLDGRTVAVDAPDAEELAPLAQLLAARRDRGWSAADDFPVPLWERANHRDLQRAGAPAAAAVASARGLAAMYAALPKVAGPDALAQVSQLQVAGDDLTTGRYFRYGLAFQLPGADHLRYGSARAVGHDGAGGAIAFYDPADDLAFGYVPRRIPLPGGADARAIRIAEIAHRCARAAHPQEA
ncbi:CubicO group peptidase (beta-lactamase class C family) [Streptomyces sp. PsTaAH-137]|nr:serine hydrolase domain-containing protein [Streptomyces sp. SID8367]RAJ85023.1 CubicO group peptidase (beta-lactamase class C family) [Streptomyces sp. PsTaAH-137]